MSVMPHMNERERRKVKDIDYKMFDVVGKPDHADESRLTPIRTRKLKAEDTNTTQEKTELDDELDGRIFVSRLLNWLRSAFPCNNTGNRNWIFRKIPSEVLKDLKWWHFYLQTYNGITMMSINEWSKPDEHVSFDACLDGLGAIGSDKYFNAVFPSFIPDFHLHINSLELLTIVVSLKMWGKHFMGKKIVVYCDNEASVTVLNTGFSRDMFMQSCLRETCYLAAVHGFEIRARHIVGVENRAADYLSRWYSNYKNTVNFKSCIEGGNYREVEVLEEFFMFSHDW